MTDRDGYLMFQPKGLLTKKDEHELFFLAVLSLVVVSVVVWNVEHYGMMDKTVEFISTFIANL